MELTPELIAAAKKVFPAVAFIKTDQYKATHELYDDFAAHYPNWPKVVFYIVCNDIFGLPTGRDAKGLFGWQLVFDITAVPDNLRPRSNKN